MTLLRPLAAADPNPQILTLARDGKFLDVISAARRLSGFQYDADAFHRAALAVDTVFGAYQNLEIACTSAAHRPLVEAGLTPREAEHVADWWLRHWRQGCNKNCPKDARRPSDVADPRPRGEGGRDGPPPRPEPVDRDLPG